MMNKSLQGIFEHKIVCNDLNIKHYDHPSCCQLEEFVSWRKVMLKPLEEFQKVSKKLEDLLISPLREYDDRHPVPRFEGGGCIFDGRDHIDGPGCCQHADLAKWRTWFYKALYPFGFGDLESIPM